ncbi:MAG: helix-turn-helix domain-containing protein [Acidobacteria bacterium]|nr:helix-turn-helix domain-containing protein [Acidobacteriota bacterium]MBI3487584.1 helix-turn-helix domain-containing protein [Acidobacteriota bacterium]
MSDAPIPSRVAWSVRDFCSHFSVSRATVYRAFDAGLLVRLKLGRKTLIPDDSVQAWWSSIQKAG